MNCSVKYKYNKYTYKIQPYVNSPDKWEETLQMKLFHLVCAVGCISWHQIQLDFVPEPSKHHQFEPHVSCHHHGYQIVGKLLGILKEKHIFDIFKTKKYAPTLHRSKFTGWLIKIHFFWYKRNKAFNVQMITDQLSVIHLFTESRNRINFQYHTVNGRNEQTWFTRIISYPSLSRFSNFSVKMFEFSLRMYSIKR